MSTADLCRYPQRPADPGRISVADMAELVGAGEAVQLLSEFNVGPTWWNGEWWYVPQGPGQGARGYAMAGDGGRPTARRGSTQWTGHSRS